MRHATQLLSLGGEGARLRRKSDSAPAMAGALSRSKPYRSPRCRENSETVHLRIARRATTRSDRELLRQRPSRCRSERGRPVLEGGMPAVRANDPEPVPPVPAVRPGRPRAYQKEIARPGESGEHRRFTLCSRDQACPSRFDCGDGLSGTSGRDTAGTLGGAPVCAHRRHCRTLVGAPTAVTTTQRAGLRWRQAHPAGSKLFRTQWSALLGTRHRRELLLVADDLSARPRQSAIVGPSG